MSEQRPLIEFKNITYRYPQGPSILSDISFSLSAGESLGIVGPNGGGKSTLLKIVVGALCADSGNIYWEGQQVTADNPISRQQIGYISQKNQINPVMPLTVAEVIEQGTIGPKNLSGFGLQEMGELVGLQDKMGQIIHHLSGGEIQRVLLARAIISRPKLLVLDEPDTGLDSTGQDQLFHLLQKIKTSFQTAIVVVDHNLGQILKHSTKIICLNQTSHWHNKTELLTKNVLENIYHCEFEHLKIHDSPQIAEHHLCEHGPEHLREEKKS